MTQYYYIFAYEHDQRFKMRWEYKWIREKDVNTLEDDVYGLEDDVYGLEDDAYGLEDDVYGL